MIDGELQRRIEKVLEPTFDRLKVSIMETQMNLEEWREEYDRAAP